LGHGKTIEGGSAGPAGLEEKGRPSKTIREGGVADMMSGVYVALVVAITLVGIVLGFILASRTNQATQQQQQTPQQPQPNGGNAERMFRMIRELLGDENVRRGGGYVSQRGENNYEASVEVRR
jgi:preprotein translocase subunit SecG